MVPNGIPLSKIHHAAFDAHLIGIDADYRLHVSEWLLGQNEGPMLGALKRFHGATIHLPNRTKNRPDHDLGCLSYSVRRLARLGCRFRSPAYAISKFLTPGRPIDRSQAQLNSMAAGLPV